MFQRRIGKVIAFLCLCESVAIHFSIVKSRREIDIHGGTVEVDTSQIHRRNANKNDERQENEATNPHPFSADAIVGVNGYIMNFTLEPDTPLRPRIFDSEYPQEKHELSQVAVVAGRATPAEAKNPKSHFGSSLAEVDNVLDKDNSKRFQTQVDSFDSAVENTTLGAVSVTRASLQTVSILQKTDMPNSTFVLQSMVIPLLVIFLACLLFCVGFWFSSWGNALSRDTQGYTQH